MSQDTPGGASGAALLEALCDQVRQAHEQLRQAYEREQQAQQEKARLLAMLEAEQTARRNLEQKLLLAPQPQPDPPQRHHRLWALLLVLAMAIAALVWNRTSVYWSLG